MNMKINEQIINILKDFNINPDDGIPYLLALHFNYNPEYIPDSLKQKINISKIVEQENTGLKWNIALFEGSTIDQAWDWVVNEYIALFAKIGKGTHKREAVSRMKRLFANNPELRKDDVLGATEMYLYNTNAKFARLPHYFIEKGVGGNKTQDILEWIDKYKLTQDSFQDRDISRRLL